MNQRYKELKHEGKTYTKKYQIDEILLENDFNWFLDCEVENMRLEIMKETLIINAGIFYNGIWEYGVLRDVDWRAGTFKNGVIYNGIFKRITVEKGIIFNGTFLRGDILFADIRGGEFKDINISTNVNQTQTGTQTQSQVQPIQQIQSGQTQTQSGQTSQSDQTSQSQVQGESTVKTQGQVKGKEGQEIQAQVQENMKIVKSYNNFIKK